MKVLAIGGTGVFGARAVGFLAADDRVESVVVASRSAERAARLRAAYGPKCEPTVLELDDLNREADLGRDCDVVLNAAGPAYRYAESLARHAIDTGKPYVDLCDDAAATEAVFGLHERALARSVTVLVGLGCSPGVTNLTARLAAEQLDRVDAVHVLHGGSTERSLGGLANIMHLFDLIDGEIPVLRGGRIVQAPGFSDLRPHDFGPPLGRLRTGLIAHPEPVMFHRSWPELREASVRLGLAPEAANDLLAAARAFGLTSIEPIRIAGVDIPRREFLARHLHEYAEKKAATSEDPEAVPFAMHVVVEGERDGARETLVYRVFDDVTSLISGALALGAIWLGSRRVEASGVRTPDECIDARLFLSELADAGVCVPAPAESIAHVQA